MASFLLVHRHSLEECPAVFAAWAGLATPLRGTSTWASCLSGGHSVWWTVEAESATGALAFLPAYVAQRTEVIRISRVTIP